MIGADY